jgi:hypothetical protein
LARDQIGEAKPLAIELDPKSKVVHIFASRAYIAKVMFDTTIFPASIRGGRRQRGPS